MATQQTRVRRNLKVNQGRIIRLEQQLGRVEQRVERLEKQNVALKEEASKRDPKLGQQKIAQLERQNANLKDNLSKLRARVDQNTKDNKQNADFITRLVGISAPVQALVRSFKQTPGAPFTAWRMWMLSTFRKQGLYRKQMFR
ncbi:MAG: hypothetical protein BMS9Abin37_1278 [Acidobacteriota bacterium]|nr:MAG: hypothetical protein BMS9Abin37_1278 [Acidobacteriota bacterium]